MAWPVRRTTKPNRRGCVSWRSSIDRPHRSRVSPATVKRDWATAWVWLHRRSAGCRHDARAAGRKSISALTPYSTSNLRAPGYLNRVWRTSRRCWRKSNPSSCPTLRYSDFLKTITRTSAVRRPLEARQSLVGTPHRAYRIVEAIGAGGMARCTRGPATISIRSRWASKMVRPVLRGARKLALRLTRSRVKPRRTI